MFLLDVQELLIAIAAQYQVLWVGRFIVIVCCSLVILYLSAWRWVESSRKPILNIFLTNNHSKWQNHQQNTDYPNEEWPNASAAFAYWQILPNDNRWFWSFFHYWPYSIDVLVLVLPPVAASATLSHWVSLYSFVSAIGTLELSECCHCTRWMFPCILFHFMQTLVHIGMNLLNFLPVFNFIFRMDLHW